MEANFWHGRREENEIGFHLAETNPWLVKHLLQLKLVTGEGVFIPLGGRPQESGLPGHHAALEQG